MNKNYSESSLVDLYNSSVAAFPKTTKRQHSTDPIQISNLRWIPYMGIRTLFVKGLAQNEENGHEYTPMMVFKDMKYHNKNDSKGLINLIVEGRSYLFEPVSLKNTDVLLRCNCADFKWRFNYTDHVDKSLYGRVRGKYEALYRPGSSNPMQLEGMCKHLIKLSKALGEAGIFGT